MWVTWTIHVDHPTINPSPGKLYLHYLYKMNSKAQIIQESRKIIKSWLGIGLACVHTFIFAMFISFAISFVIEMPSSGLKALDQTEGLICWTIGLVPRIVEGHGRDYSVFAFSLYFVASLFQMYIPFRALIQPSFLAGKPNFNVRRMCVSIMSFTKHFFSHLSP